MTANVKKSTKKFQHKHLKATLDRRRETKKIKQRAAQKEKRKARNAADRAGLEQTDNQDENVDDEKSGGQQEKKKKKREHAGGADLASISVDEFFQNGFCEVADMEGNGEQAGAGIALNVPQLPAKLKRKVEEEEGKRKKRKSRLEDDGEEEEVLNGVHEQDQSEEDGKEGDEQDEEDDEDLDDADTHKHDLAALKDKDPEFYRYLHDNDAELLDFEDKDDDVEEKPPKKSKKSESKRQKQAKAVEKDADDDDDDDDAGADRTNVTTASVSKWRAAMETQHSLRAMRHAVLAFRAAATLHADDDKTREQKYVIADPETYHELLVATMSLVPTVLAHHLPVKATAAGKQHVATDSKKFRTCAPLLKTYALSILQLLGNLSDGPTIRMTINALLPLLPYILSYKKIVKLLLKAVVDIYTTAAGGNEESSLVTAFLLLRRLAAIADTSIREAILKQTYQGLVKGARNTNSHTIAFINLMKNSCVDLWTLDPDLSYTTGFVYIRQLAIHLRTAITRPTKESHKLIYNWQYIHSLDFWSRILSSACSPQTNPRLKQASDSPLHPLIYPVVQITLGALRLIPSPAYFPLRFHLTQALLRISRTTTTYIPLAPCLLEVLSSPELSKRANPSTLPPLDFSIALRAPKSYLRTRTFQTGAGEQAHDLLAEFFGCWAKNIAFPELIIPPTVMLKRWLKSVSSPSRANGTSNGRRGGDHKQARKSQGNSNGKLNASIHVLLGKLTEQATFVESHRRNVTYAPSDRAQVETFLREVEWADTPLGAYVLGVRARAEQREQVVREGRRVQVAYHENDDEEGVQDDEDVEEEEEEEEEVEEQEGVVLDDDGEEEDVEDDDSEDDVEDDDDDEEADDDDELRKGLRREMKFLK